ncbi:MAG: hypothetical protein NC911_03015 [Candidatus Omnitrophica bacterium]|nr:hypothetical protein [Candidatus Omnitrophota bacterium]
MNNLKQWGIVFTMYAQDYGVWISNAQDLTGNNQWPSAFVYAMGGPSRVVNKHTHIQGLPPWFCQGEFYKGSNYYQFMDGYAGHSNWKGATGGLYLINQNIFTGANVAPELLTNPSTLVLLCDGTKNGGNYTSVLKFENGVWVDYSGPSYPANKFAEWHRGTGSVLFCDGHVEARTKRSLEDENFWKRKGG